MTAADRPSVTDNARAEEQSGYTVQQTAAHFARRVQRVSDRIRSTDYQRSVSDIVALDNVEGFLDRIARDDLDVFAAGRAETTTQTPPAEAGATADDAGEEVPSGRGEFSVLPRSLGGRAETTTATTEDAEAAVVDALGQSPFAHHEVIPSGETASTLYITHDDEWSELASLIVQMLASRGLLATARTATTEDAEEVLHGAGWFARADLDPRDLRGILHDLADAGLLRGGDE